MRTYRRTVVTDLEPREVWEYLADFAATDEWDPRARHGRLVEGDGGVGSRYETDVHFLGRTTRMAYTVTRLEAPQWIEWVGENRMVRAHDVIEVRSCGPGSVVHYASSYEYRVLPALLGWLMSRPLAQLCDEARDGLQATLDRHAAGRSGV